MRRWPFLGFGFAPHTGRPIKLLLDTGADIIVLCESEAAILIDPTPDEPIRVVGDRLIHPIRGGTLPFQYKLSPTPYPIPFLEAFFGPSTALGLAFLHLPD